MKIIIFKGSSQYDVLSIYSLLATSELQKLGVNAVTWEMSLMNSNDYLRFVDRFQPDVTFGFNPVTYFYEDGQNHIMKTNIPHILRLGDHPYYHLNNRAMLNPNHSKLLTVTTEKFFEHALDSNNIKRYKRVNNLPGINVSGNVKFSEKTIPVSYFGSYQSINQILSDIQIHYKGSPRILKILMNFCGDLERLMTQERKYIQTSIEILFERYIRDNIVVDENQLETLVKNTFVHIDRFHRNLIRKIALTEIAKNGIEMYVFSSSALREILEKYPNVKFFNPVNFLESIHIISQSKANINITPMFTSLHERITNSYLNSSILFSNNMYDFMGNNKELSEGSIFFDQYTIKDEVEKLNSIISNENLFNNISQQNFELAQKKFTFKQELEMIEKALKYDF